MSSKILNVEIVDKHGNKVNFDYTGRQVWLKTINFVSLKQRGSGNYSYDIVGTYRLDFQINDGSNRKAFSSAEEYYIRVYFELSEWCTPDVQIAQELSSILNTLPKVLDKEDVIKAFIYRDYYRIEGIE